MALNLGIGLLESTADLKSWHHLLYHCNALGHPPYSNGAVLGIHVTRANSEIEGEHWLVNYFIGERYSHTKMLPYQKDVLLYPAAMGYGEETFKIRFRRGNNNRAVPPVPDILYIID